MLGKRCSLATHSDQVNMRSNQGNLFAAGERGGNRDSEVLVRWLVRTGRVLELRVVGPVVQDVAEDVGRVVAGIGASIRRALNHREDEADLGRASQSVLRGVSKARLRHRKLETYRLVYLHGKALAGADGRVGSRHADGNGLRIAGSSEGGDDGKELHYRMKSE